MCDQRERLMDYLYDEAPPADRREVEAHLEECGDCRREIRAFRRVREDLLAWDVPAVESVWTPFAPSPVVVPWYRQAPAWAMTAAAGVMLLLGVAGGVASRALLPDGAQQAPMAVAPPTALAAVVPEPEPMVIAPVSVAPAPVGLSDADIIRLVRGEMARVSAGEALSARQAEVLVAEAAAQQWGRLQEYLTAVARERELERKSTEQMLGGLRAQVSDLQAAMSILISQQSKGQQ